jgi:hypothetical protein
MSILLISHDEVATRLDRETILSFVETYPHVRIAHGAFAIETNEKTCTVFKKILPQLGVDVQLLVVTLARPFAGPLAGPIAPWLTKRLPEE